MIAFGRFRTSIICLFNAPVKPRYCSLVANPSEVDSELPKTLLRKLTLDESQLLECVVKHNFYQAREVLDKMPQRGNQSRVVTWTSILTKFSKGGYVDEARAVFEIMPDRTVVTYNAMLSGYIQSGRLRDACRFFRDIPQRNVVSWTSMLYGLMNGGMVEEGKRFFEEMPERNVVTWNSMVVGLIKNGDLEGARHIFDAMPAKDLVSWNSIIDGYAENYRMDEARALFDLMEEKNVVTWTTVISGYCRVGDVESAYELFVRMPKKNVVSWTAMISGFAWNGSYREAILIFLKMRSSDVKPNEETFVSLAYACAGLGFPQLGMQLHAQIIVNYAQSDDHDRRLFNSMIYMYSKFGMMDHAESLFVKNSRCWTIHCCNAMINGYVRTGELEKAQNTFDIVPFRDKISWTCMISGYFSVGRVAKACELFKSMPDRDAVAWTVMISGHVQNELFLEASYLFSEMRMQGISPLQSTYSTLLGAAGATAHLQQGRQMHCLLMKTQPVPDLILENSLITMYAKCGLVDDACRIFSNMGIRDLVSWNSMIMGYSYHGRAHEALELFDAMMESGIKPNSVTFLGILSACSHAGLIDQGWVMYRNMSDMYGIQPDFEHHISMIDLLGRAGKAQEAEEFVSRLPSGQYVALWGALLGVCGLSKVNNEIAKCASNRLIKLDPLNAPAHIVLCNLHASDGQYHEEEMLRKAMILKGIRKVPGCSWISRGGRVHVFLSGDRPLS
ncbi:hypothetical protein Nepgr_011094 [Nepenthes gracilis]|uniref:Pentatricopeptide repeat-containing protein n=1 Tax=Nepenthes gracilis TaxID=150966 RepID=A0AAD3XLM7_NEPGR|nr:hypothetical protein Nepgr_011094 [Nepenthes gracilis]